MEDRNERVVRVTLQRFCSGCPDGADEFLADGFTLTPDPLLLLEGEATVFASISERMRSLDAHSRSWNAALVAVERRSPVVFVAALKFSETSPNGSGLSLLAYAGATVNTEGLISHLHLFDARDSALRSAGAGCCSHLHPAP